MIPPSRHGPRGASISGERHRERFLTGATNRRSVTASLSASQSMQQPLQSSAKLQASSSSSSSSSSAAATASATFNASHTIPLHSLRPSTTAVTERPYLSSTAHALEPPLYEFRDTRNSTSASYVILSTPCILVSYFLFHCCLCNGV